MRFRITQRSRGASAAVAVAFAACSPAILAQHHREPAAVVPYSAVLIIDVDAAVPGGGTRHTISRTFVARDQKGRFLYTEAAPVQSTAGPEPRAIISDVTNQSRTTLDSARRHAVVEHVLLGVLSLEPPLNIPQPPPPASYERVTSTSGAPQDLGTKTIDGVLARGMLNVQHLSFQGGTDPGDFTRTTEEWRSVDGDIILEEIVHDQRGVDARVHVENLSLTPPPQSLFLVPPDYSVTEIGETTQLRDQLLAEARSSAGSLTGLAQAQAYLSIADAERLVISLPDQFRFIPTPDQRKLASMAASDSMAAFRAAANAFADGVGVPGWVALDGQTKRDGIEAGAIMIAGWESAPDQRARLLNEIVAGAERADPPRAGIYNAIIQYWYANPPLGAPSATELIRQCVEADGSFPYFGLVAVLQMSARKPIAPDESNALVQVAYQTAAKEPSNSPAYGSATMALGEIHALEPGLDQQLAETLVAMLNRPDALRSLHFQTEAQLFDLLRSLDPARAQQIAGYASAPPPLLQPSPNQVPVPPRGQVIETPEDLGDLNDLLTRAESLTVKDPQEAAQAARSAESLLLGNLSSITGATEPVWIGPAAQLAQEFQRLDMYDESAALEAKTFAGIAADAKLIQLTPAGLPNLPGPGTSIEDELLDLTATLCQLDTGIAISGAAAMPGWFKPLVLGTIVQHAAMM